MFLLDAPAERKEWQEVGLSLLLGNKVTDAKTEPIQMVVFTLSYFSHGKEEHDKSKNARKN